MAKRILRTKLCDMLGIEYPIILAGMAGIAGPQLVAAVSNAGGMGVLGVSGFTAEQLQDWIRKTKTLTDKPFGVDLLLPAMRESGTRETFKAELPAEHVTMINKWKEELGVPDAKARGQSILTIETVKKKVEVIMEEGVAAFACGLGTPEWVVPQLHGGGIKVISLVGNIKQARRVAERGTDIVVAQGHEAGGHTGRIGTLALIPQAVDAVSPLPVVAAGGIGDGRGLVATLALGAVGVWVGSAFIATHEAGIDRLEEARIDMGYSTEHLDAWKEKMLKADEEGTVRSQTYTGKTARTLKNKYTELWEQSGMPYLPMPLQGLLQADLIKGLRQAGMTDYLANFAGQITGMFKEIKPAKQVFEEMVDQACEILENGLSVKAATR